MAECPQHPTHAGARHATFVGTYRFAVTGKRGPALEDDLLDAIRVALHDAGHAWIERRPFRIGPETLADLAAHRGDILLGIFARLQLSVCLHVLFVGLLHFPHEELVHHAWKAILRRSDVGRL